MRALTVRGAPTPTGVHAHPRGVAVKLDGSALAVSFPEERAVAVVALSQAAGADAASASGGAQDPVPVQAVDVLCWLVPGAQGHRGAQPMEPARESAAGPPYAARQDDERHDDELNAAPAFRRPEFVAIDDSGDILVCDPELGKVLVFGFDGTFCGTLHPTSSPPDVSDDGLHTRWKICSVTSDPLSGFALVAHALWRHATCLPGSTNLVGV